jgi:hypothetical protein
LSALDLAIVLLLTIIISWHTCAQKNSIAG